MPRWRNCRRTTLRWWRPKGCWFRNPVSGTWLDWLPKMGANFFLNCWNPCLHCISGQALHSPLVRYDLFSKISFSGHTEPISCCLPSNPHWYKYFGRFSTISSDEAIYHLRLKSRRIFPVFFKFYNCLFKPVLYLPVIRWLLIGHRALTVAAFWILCRFFSISESVAAWTLIGLFTGFLWIIR